MVNITIPKNNINERNYALDIVFNEFFGLDYSVDNHNRAYTEIKVKDSDESLTLNDDFFKKTCNEWLKEESIPGLPLQVWSPKEDGLVVDLVKDSVPILYGQPGLVKKDKHWHLNLDVFGSAFFMLSRYEELVTKDRDKHDRFPATASVAYKAGFLDRPIVNEYLEILWACMHQLWPNLTRRTFQSKTFISCDVDQPYDCSVETAPKLIRSCAGDVLKRKRPILALKRMNRFIFNKLGIYKFDPNYTFDWYMDVCEQSNLKAVFYFIPSSIEPGNGCYELTDKKIISDK